MGRGAMDGGWEAVCMDCQRTETRYPYNIKAAPAHRLHQHNIVNNPDHVRVQTGVS